ncbi:MAG: transaldolase [Gammaproteobacteria bacterium]|nr:transaldolase [Gammaproteobacteria bacterium]MBU1654828.1 transaldolase [Gammaproteobacteria bacterium]MBU1961095.1 transaldolase [Gammaproteobacteria bacterium]
MNPLKLLPQKGQSIWLDYIDRQLLTTGDLARLMADDDLRGVTSNPAIFEKAIRSDAGYRADLDALRGQGRLSPTEMLEQLVLPDIRAAADLLRGVYAATGGRDGYVSLEVPPALAHDTNATLTEARRLWQAVGRDNLMIKVPATQAGLPAISALIADGINVNVTLLFSRAMHARVAEAFLAGLEQRSVAGLPVDGIASVASFFVSRIDTEVDERLAMRLESAVGASEREAIRALMGKAAIANAKRVYRDWKRIFSGPRWQSLADRGASSQRLLWASTGVKNPAYRDVRYIEELIGPDTVNTVPPATLDAFRDHGLVRASLEEGLDEAATLLARLEGLGISLDEVTDLLLDAGVDLFVQAYDKLLARLPG